MVYILDTDSSLWNEILEKVPVESRDIYFTSQYYKLYENNGDGIGKCFVYVDGNNVAMYPFMLSEIKGYKLEKTYYDIETAYGYGGPLVNCKDEKFLEVFEDEFCRYCRENNIIAEFIRFHPLISNEDIFKKDIQVIQNRVTVYVDLTIGIEELWKSNIKSKDRSVIRKAEKNNLRVVESHDYNTFKEIYEATMQKVDADNYYYFNDKYYEFIKKDDNYILLDVMKDDIVVASAIFMHYDKYFHYHLAGSRREYLKFAPNNLLLWEAIKLASKRGAELFHFGGGLTNSLDDPLFKFKSTFSNTYSDYFIGKRVHNHDIYKCLINEWEQLKGKKATILLQYRIK